MTGAIGTIADIATMLWSVVASTCRSAARAAAPAFACWAQVSELQPDLRAESAELLSVRPCGVDPPAALRRQMSRSREMATASTLSSSCPVHIGKLVEQDAPPPVRLHSTR